MDIKTKSDYSIDGNKSILSEIPFVFINEFKPIIDYIENIEFYIGIILDDNTNSLKIISVNDEYSLDTFKIKIRAIFNKIEDSIKNKIFKYPVSIQCLSIQYIIDNLYILKNLVKEFEVKNINDDNEDVYEKLVYFDFIKSNFLYYCDIQKKHNVSFNYSTDVELYSEIGMVYDDLILPLIDSYAKSWLSIVAQIETSYSNLVNSISISAFYNKVSFDNTNELSKYNSNKSKPKTIPNSFTYLKYYSNISAINNLLLELKENDIISNSVHIKDFRKIFINEIPENKIIWIDGIESLAYFVKQLHKKSFIVDLKNIKWDVTHKIFVDFEGKSFDRKAFRWQKKPSKALLIENVINQLE